MTMPRSIYNYFRAKAAAARKAKRKIEKEIRDAEKARLKRERDYERAEAKARAVARKKVEDEEKLQRLTDRIEKKLRKQYGLPKDGTLVVVVETQNRLLEI